MPMKRILFPVTICLILCANLHAQYKSKENIQYIYELKVVNKNLFPILDSIINTKSEVTYFRDGPLLTMWFGLDSIKPDLIMIWAEGKEIMGANHDLGLFDYKENTFVVRGISLDTTVFLKTDSKRKFKFSSSPIKVLKNGTMVFDLGADKRYCTWTCRYRNGKFKLLSFGSFDDKVKRFDNIEQEYHQEGIQDPIRCNQP